MSILQSVSSSQDTVSESLARQAVILVTCTHILLNVLYRT